MTQGSEWRALLGFAIPMLVGNLFQQLYSIVDSAIVGRFVGADALAAVGASGSLHWLFFSLCIGLASGVCVIVSQYFGAKEDKNVKRVITNAFYLVGSVGMVMAVLSVVFTRGILGLMQTPEKVLGEAVIYMRIVCSGIFVVAISNVVSGILRALGDAKTPLYLWTAGCIINILLDLLFVCVFHWGSMGAGVATLLSQIIGCVLTLVYAFCFQPYFQLKKEDWKLQKQIIKRSAQIGVPMALQSSFVAVSCVMLQGVVNSFGTLVIAAFTATSRVEQFIQQPFSSLETAMSTFTGQNIGARKSQRVKTGYQKASWLAAAFCAIMILVMQCGSDEIIKIFVENEEVVAMGAKALRFTSFFYLPLGVIFVTRGLLNGAGDAKYAFVVGIVEVIGRVGGSVLLVYVLKTGVWGIWYTSCFTWTLTGIFSYVHYKRGKWRNIQLIERAEGETYE